MTGWCPYKEGTLKELECHFDGYCRKCLYYKKVTALQKITAMLDLFYANKHLYKKIGGKEK